MAIKNITSIYDIKRKEGREPSQFETGVTNSLQSGKNSLAKGKRETRKIIKQHTTHTHTQHSSFPISGSNFFIVLSVLRKQPAFIYAIFQNEMGQWPIISVWLRLSKSY